MQFNINNDLSSVFNISGICVFAGMFDGLQLSPLAVKIDELTQGYITTLFGRKILRDTMPLGYFLPIFDIPNYPEGRFFLVNCGNKNDFNIHIYNTLISKIIELCDCYYINKIFFGISELDIIGYDDQYWKIRKTIEIFYEKLYFFTKLNDGRLLNAVNNCCSLDEIILNLPMSSSGLQDHRRAIRDGMVISESIKIAIDLGNMPPNLCTPEHFVLQVQKLSNDHAVVTTEIVDVNMMRKMGMNAYLAVGEGSKYDPVMPIMYYRGALCNNNIKKNIPPIVLIGKGVTFDSGGLSIKPSDKMDEMKYDMCGAAVVYAVMNMAVKLKLPLNIIGVLAVCENMISRFSFRPGDILTTLSGKTVEVLNTDAEGRLILCDVLTYVARYCPDLVIDIATLTGACVVALGHHFSGLMSNNEKLANDLLLAANQSKDYVWRLPLEDTFHEKLRSKCADMKNVGDRSGDAITAACFLQKFVCENYAWAHLDIAGTAWTADHAIKSATGRPVALLSQFLLNKSIL